MAERAQAWRPEGFAAYRERFPATTPLTLPDMAPTAAFIARWHRLGEAAGGPIGELRTLVGGRAITVVLVRGYLGNYMRGNLVSVRQALRAAGIDAFIAKTRAGATVADNARLIAPQVVARVGQGGARRLVFAGHSKGGLEALQVLADRPELAARTDAVVLSQTPRRPSPVLESVLLGMHAGSLSRQRRRAEWVQRLGLGLLRARPGGLELTGERLPAVIARLDAAPRPFRVLQTASWSSVPTTWLDSFHERLGEIRPGVAHDGQFYLEDLLWPAAGSTSDATTWLEHVLLPHLDHAQPVMDGFGFDAARYWVTMLAGVLGP